MPSMHRKHSSDGRRSRIHGRNSGGVHRQVQEINQKESSGSYFKKRIKRCAASHKNTFHQLQTE